MSIWGYFAAVKLPAYWMPSCGVLRLEDQGYRGERRRRSRATIWLPFCHCGIALRLCRKDGEFNDQSRLYDNTVRRRSLNRRIIIFPMPHIFIRLQLEVDAGVALKRCFVAYKQRAFFTPIFLPKQDMHGKRILGRDCSLPFRFGGARNTTVLLCHHVRCCVGVRLGWSSYAEARIPSRTQPKILLSMTSSHNSSCFGKSQVVGRLR